MLRRRWSSYRFKTGTTWSRRRCASLSRYLQTSEPFTSIAEKGQPPFTSSGAVTSKTQRSKPGVVTPQLVILPSRYRLNLAPIVEYVLEAERCCPNQQIAVLIPELVQRRWYHQLLHSKRGSVLKALLPLKHNQLIIVINVPWYLAT